MSTPGELDQSIGGNVRSAVYLDNHATTPMDPRVRAALMSAFDAVGNAGSADHAFGWSAAQRLGDARSAVATMIRATSEEIYFTSGATESNNIAVIGGALNAPSERRRLLIGAAEHKSVIEAAEALSERGFTIEWLTPNSDGIIDPQQVRAKIDSDVVLVSIMAVNNEVGTVAPIGTYGEMVRAAGAMFHVDGTQAATAIDIDCRAWRADTISLSSHKIYGPGGVGALFVADDAPWRPKPLIFGGGQEEALRPGTVPTPLCVGFGEAARLISDEGLLERQDVAALRDALQEGLRRLNPNARVTGADVVRHSGSLHVRFPGIDASELLLRIQPFLAASTASACSSGIIGASHVLLAIGMSEEEAKQCIRFSLGRFSTEADIADALQILGDALVRMVHSEEA